MFQPLDLFANELLIPDYHRLHDERSPDGPHIDHMEMRDVLWSDWGNPARIADALDKIGKQPAFAEEALPFIYQG